MNMMRRPPRGAETARARPIEDPEADLPRRGLLRALAGLPLIGGSVAILGRPTAAVEPLSPALLDSYDAWLWHERRFLQFERGRWRHPRSSWAPGYVRGNGDIEWVSQIDVVPHSNEGAHWHWPGQTPEPSTRAAIVLSAVGCPWRPA